MFVYFYHNGRLYRSQHTEDTVVHCTLLEQGIYFFSDKKLKVK